MSGLWVTIIIIGLFTFGIRLSGIILLGKLHLPLYIQRFLHFVPIAVLSALISPALFLPDGTLDLSFGNFRLLAGLFAALIAWRTRNVFLTIVGGMVCLWVLQALFTAHL